MSYDATGSIITPTVSGTDVTLTYDQENRLSTVTGTGSATMWYDGDGKRVKAIVTGVSTNYYVGDYYERDNGGTVKTHHSLGGVRVAMRSSTDPFHV